MTSSCSNEAQCCHDANFVVNSTETKRWSRWLFYRHWVHLRWSPWLPQVQPVTTKSSTWQLFRFSEWHRKLRSRKLIITGDPLHSRAACTQPCNVNTHSRAHCSPAARLCEQWGHGCVNNGARLCASARLCRGSPVIMLPMTTNLASWWPSVFSGIVCPTACLIRHIPLYRWVSARKT